jgi:LysM repeat protein
MMSRKQWVWLSLFGLLLLAWILAPSQIVRADRVQEQSASTLITAVNNLRLANGLAPLNTHPILMQVAQSQADALLATEGAVGHGRPNGMTFTQQLLLLGYPLSGDLSLGGYRSENYVFGYGMTEANAVEAWQGDDPHTNTMLSPNRSDIGAGVSIGSDGTVYFVIDTALQTSSGLPQSDADLYLPGGGGTALNPEDALSQYIVPVTVSTAHPNGDVYHKVQYGQSLWGIAIEYHTKIDLIRQLNNLGEDNTVYPNQLLLVMRGATQPAPAAMPTVLPATMEPSSDTPETMTPMHVPTATALVEQSTASESSGPSFGVTILVLVLLIVVGGGTAVWFIREPAQETRP